MITFCAWNKYSGTEMQYASSCAWIFKKAYLWNKYRNAVCFFKIGTDMQYAFLNIQAQICFFLCLEEMQYDSNNNNIKFMCYSRPMWNKYASSSKHRYDHILPILNIQV